MMINNVDFSIIFLSCCLLISLYLGREGKKNQGRLRKTALEMRLKPYYWEACLCVGRKGAFLLSRWHRCLKVPGTVTLQRDGKVMVEQMGFSAV